MTPQTLRVSMPMLCKIRSRLADELHLQDDVAARKFLDDVRKIKPPEKLQFFVEIPGPDGKPQRCRPIGPQKRT